jgi:hypothetical protein
MKEVSIPHSDWIALCEALDASPDIQVADLALKARRLKESRTKYARQALEPNQSHIVQLEAALRERSERLHGCYKHEGPWSECEWFICESDRAVLNGESAGEGKPTR